MGRRTRLIGLVLAASAVLASGPTGAAIASDMPLSTADGTDAAVDAIARDGAGRTYIGGEFTSVGRPIGGGVLVAGSGPGTPDPGEFPAVAGHVFAVAPDGSGGFYLGGSFTGVGGLARHNLAHVLADRSVDATWRPDANDTVRALLVSGSDVYVGGRFTSVGGQGRNFIARLRTATGAADPAWNANANNVVRALAISGTNLYVGGAFTSIGGQARNSIAKLNASTGTADPAWNPDPDAGVEALAVSGPDVYAGGAFTSIGGQARNSIAKLNASTGTADPTWNPNANNAVFALTVSGTDLYVGGDFDSIGGQTRSRIAKLSTVTGSADPGWDASAAASGGASASVDTLAASGSAVYAGGFFTSIGGQARNDVAKLNTTDGAADPAWNANPNGRVQSVAIVGSSVYIGGDFTSAGNLWLARNHIARLNADGSLDLNWSPAADGSVNAITVAGSDVYAGGGFTSVGGQSRNRIAKLSATDGSADSDWNPSANGIVEALAVSGSNVYVGGSFTSIGGQPRNNIAKLNTTNGNADLAWDPNANNTVLALAVSGTDVYAGGTFQGVGSIGGQTRNRIAKLNPTSGNADPTWNPNANNTILALAVSGTDVYAGGFFFGADSIGGQARNRVARLNATTGAADPAWNPDANHGVMALAVSGGDVYAGGLFGSIGGQARNHLARLDTTTGAADPTWDPNADDQVSALAASGSNVYAGGAFDSVHQRPAAGFAQFVDHATLSPAAPGTGAFGDQAVGSSSSPQTFRLTNTSTTDPLHIASIGAGSDRFMLDLSACQTDGSFKTLAPGGSCDVTATFTPTSIGAVFTDLTAVADGETRTVALSGTGVALPSPAGTGEGPGNPPSIPLVPPGRGRLSRAAHARGKAFIVTLVCSGPSDCPFEPATFSTTLRGAARAKRLSMGVLRRTFVAAGQTEKVRVRIPSRSLAALQRRHVRKATLIATVTIAFASGPIRTSQRVVLTLPKTKRKRA